MATTDSTTARCDPQRLDYVAFTGRTPFVTDAWSEGFAVGVREDCRLQQDTYESLNLPVWFLDNNFHDPDLDRYLDVADTLNPRVGVLGDAATVDHARRLLDAIPRLKSRVDGDVRPVIVPKSRRALEEIPTDVTVGYANGASDTVASDFSTPDDWAGRDVHILGGSPPTQWAAIQRLTARGDQTTLGRFAGAVSSANIVGVDWNGVLKVAYLGEYWNQNAPHWRDADSLSIRETVRRGLKEIRSWWRDRDLWPRSTPRMRARSDEGFVKPELSHPTPCGYCGDRVDSGASIATWETTDGFLVPFCSESCADWGVRGVREETVGPESRKLSGGFR